MDGWMNEWMNEGRKEGRKEGMNEWMNEWNSLSNQGKKHSQQSYGSCSLCHSHQLLTERSHRDSGNRYENIKRIWNQSYNINIYKALTLINIYIYSKTLKVTNNWTP